MNKISIVKAVHQSMVGAQLNVMALEYMAFPLAGSEEKNTVDWTFCKYGGRRTTVLVINTPMKLKWTGKL